MEQPGRDELIAWSESRTASFFDAVPELTELLELRMGRPAGPQLLDELRRFGRSVAETIEYATPGTSEAGVQWSGGSSGSWSIPTS